MLKHTLIAALLAASGLAHADTPLLNLSCDVAREFGKDSNAAHAWHWSAGRSDGGVPELICLK